MAMSSISRQRAAQPQRLHLCSTNQRWHFLGSANAAAQHRHNQYGLLYVGSVRIHAAVTGVRSEMAAVGRGGGGKLSARARYCT